VFGDDFLAIEGHFHDKPPARRVEGYGEIWAGTNMGNGVILTGYDGGSTCLEYGPFRFQAAAAIATDHIGKFAHHIFTSSLTSVIWVPKRLYTTALIQSRWNEMDRDPFAAPAIPMMPVTHPKATSFFFKKGLPGFGSILAMVFSTWMAAARNG
jgi:hypothetical protein